VDTKRQVIFSLGFNFNVFPFLNRDAALSCPTTKSISAMEKWKIHLKYYISSDKFNDFVLDSFLFQKMDPCRGIKESCDGFGRQLHRSVSMITQPLAQHLRSSQEPDGSITGVSQRRRTSSADEQGIDGGLALLRSPSKALQDTVKLMSGSHDHAATQSTLPVLDFVAQRHDLDSLRTSMELALRKASCRVFAMEVCHH
jgi:hypothetical protein